MSPSLNDIATAVAWRHEIRLDDIRRLTRARKYTRPRQIAMYLSRELTDETLEEIGGYFSRHHTTILWGIKRVADLIDKNPDFAGHVNECRSAISQIAA